MSEHRTEDPTAPSPIGPDTDPAGGPVKSCFGQCTHPIDCTAKLATDPQGRPRNNMEYGLVARVDWRSPTGKLADLKKCYISENLKFTPIPNPPFHESGDAKAKMRTTSRRQGKSLQVGKFDVYPEVKRPEQGTPASEGYWDDGHILPRQCLTWPPLPDPPPPVEARGQMTFFAVGQSLDYYCTECNSGWVSMAKWVILFEVVRSHGGVYMFIVTQGDASPSSTSPPFQSREPILL